MTNSQVRYSTGTGQAPSFDLTEAESDELGLYGHELGQFEEDYFDVQPYCFVCKRPTEHVAEHDDLVDAGKAAYSGYDVLALA